MNTHPHQVLKPKTFIPLEIDLNIGFVNLNTNNHDNKTSHAKKNDNDHNKPLNTQTKGISQTLITRSSNVTINTLSALQTLASPRNTYSSSTRMKTRCKTTVLTPLKSRETENKSNIAGSVITPREDAFKAEKHTRRTSNDSYLKLNQDNKSSRRQFRPDQRKLGYLKNKENINNPLDNTKKADISRRYSSIDSNMLEESLILITKGQNFDIDLEQNNNKKEKDNKNQSGYLSKISINDQANIYNNIIDNNNGNNSIRLLVSSESTERHIKKLRNPFVVSQLLKKNNNNKNIKRYDINSLDLPSKIKKDIREAVIVCDNNNIRDIQTIDLIESNQGQGILNNRNKSMENQFSRMLKVLSRNQNIKDDMTEACNPLTRRISYTSPKSAIISKGIKRSSQISQEAFKKVCYLQEKKSPNNTKNLINIPNNEESKDNQEKTYQLLEVIRNKNKGYKHSFDSSRQEVRLPLGKFAFDSKETMIDLTVTQSPIYSATNIILNLSNNQNHLREDINIPIPRNYSRSINRKLRNGYMTNKSTYKNLNKSGLGFAKNLIQYNKKYSLEQGIIPVEFSQTIDSSHYTLGKPNLVKSKLDDNILPSLYNDISGSFANQKCTISKKLFENRDDTISIEMNNNNEKIDKENEKIRPKSIIKSTDCIENKIIEDSSSSIIIPIIYSKKKSPEKKRKMRERMLNDMMKSKLDGWDTEDDDDDDDVN